MGRGRAIRAGSTMSPRAVQSMIARRLLFQTIGAQHKIQAGFAPHEHAVGPDRTIYTDTNESLWSTASALVEIQPGGHVRRLWISR